MSNASRAGPLNVSAVSDGGQSSTRLIRNIHSAGALPAGWTMRRLKCVPAQQAGRGLLEARRKGGGHMHIGRLQHLQKLCSLLLAHSKRRCGTRRSQALQRASSDAASGGVRHFKRRGGRRCEEWRGQHVVRGKDQHLLPPRDRVPTLWWRAHTLRTTTTGTLQCPMM